MKNESNGILALKEEYNVRRNSVIKIIGFPEHSLPIAYWQGVLGEIEYTLERLEELLK